MQSREQIGLSGTQTFIMCGRKLVDRSSSEKKPHRRVYYLPSPIYYSSYPVAEADRYSVYVR